MIKPCIKCGAVDRYADGACKPCKNERVLKWHEANREKLMGQQRKYREANRERLAERQREYYEANREKSLERRRKYYEANREKVGEQQRKWAEANPEKVKSNNRNRRARKKGNGGKLSSNIVQTLMVLQKGKCACCNKSLKDGYHLDHSVPLALGGMNDDSNVQLLTPKCNLSKGAKHPIDFMRAKGRLI